MKPRKTFARTAVAVAIGLAVGSATLIGGFSHTTEDGFRLVSTAIAGQGAGSGKGHQGEGQGAGMGQRGPTQGQQRGKDVSSLLSAEDGGDDSDRPDWAMGNKEANPHSGDPNPTPGITKGDEYGDLYVVVRDPVTGVPILVDGELQICLDANCTETVTTVEGEIPAGVIPAEVVFSRLNIGRSPTAVLEHAEEEALAKITTDGVTLALDPAGRITVDGVTIDSPLENLALYIGLMTNDPTVLTALAPLLDDLSAQELAARLLGGAADKTGEITVDLVFYTNQIYDIVEGNQVVDYSAFIPTDGQDVYDRSIYDVTVNYYYLDEDGVTVKLATVNLKEYLDATQPALDGASGITLFSLASDDALEVVELLHTQIHDAALAGTVQ